MKARERIMELREVLNQNQIAEIIWIQRYYISRWLKDTSIKWRADRLLESDDVLEKTFYTKHNKINISIEKR